ncbi:TadE family protein [Cupriavidus sp. D39]|uniref:TadE family protein n=1 Tax=Cupriavidus sp. D39 TaxID=2997877 RepID=UPI00226DE3EE|nr:TadE/TadG family type IV pilus assembly protein [Cupriavidus sp. D39]MCY0858028.1 pilus assembly protein [Cupriavidus sp. D39]
MKRTRPLRRRQAARGIAAIEFGILLPIFIFLTLPVIDFARAIQANLILVNLTREGANLASRSAAYTPQDIMVALAQTTPPLKMSQRGMIYITKVMGDAENCAGGNCTVRNIVLEQYRWTGGWSLGGSVPGSLVWNCGSGSGSWASDGSCAGLPSGGTSSPTANAMTGLLSDGQIVYVVESYYNFDMYFKGLTMGVLKMPNIGPNLYSVTSF